MGRRRHMRSANEANKSFAVRAESVKHEAPNFRRRFRVYPRDYYPSPGLPDYSQPSWNAEGNWGAANTGILDAHVRCQVELSLEEHAYASQIPRFVHHRSDTKSSHDNY